MKTVIKSTLLIALFSIITSCNINISDGKSGNGNVISEERDITENFTEIKGNRGLVIYLTQGEENSIKVEADENLMQYITTKVSNGKLTISSDENLSGNATKNIYVSFKNLSQIEVSSGAEIEVNGQLKSEILNLEASSGSSINANIFSKELNVKTSSGADITLSGLASQLIAKSSSGSEIEAKELRVAVAQVQASSGAEITVNAQDRLDTKASSGGQVNYVGNTAEVTANNSSSGSTEKI